MSRRHINTAAGFCRPFYIFIIFAGLTLAGCAQRQNDPVVASQDNLDGVTNTILREHIPTLANEFTEQTIELAELANQFCATFSSSDLALAQSQWQLVNQKWFALANYRFGPVVGPQIFSYYTFIDSFRVRGVNFLESNRAELLADLDSNQELNDQYYASKTYQFLGLLPLEVLLFETLRDAELSPDAVATEYEQNPRKCEMLFGQINQVVNIAEKINLGWQANYLESGKPYPDYLSADDDPLAEILTSVQEHMDYLHKRVVVNNVATLAGSIWPSLKSTIFDVELLLQGDGSSTMTLFAIMQGAGNQAAVEEVKENIAFALASIEEQDQVNLELALTLLDGNFKRTIPDALDVNLGINFSDGD